METENTVENTAPSDSHARMIAGLRPPWRAGDPSPNPHGRPKVKPITCCAEYQVTSELPAKLLSALRFGSIRITLPKGSTYAHFMTMGQIIAAAKGNTQAFAELLNRIEGKVPNPIEISGPDGGPIVIDDLAAGRARVRAWREKRGQVVEGQVVETIRTAETNGDK